MNAREVQLRLERLARDPIALAATVVILCYAAVALLVAAGVLAPDADARVGAKYLGPGPGHWLGTDRQGRDVLARAIHSTKIAFTVGLVAALVSTIAGSVLGAIAGYFSGAADALVVWLYSTVQSIPHLLLLIAIAYAAGRGLPAVYLALAATYWVAPCRSVRAEVMTLRDAEFVQAARSLGYGTWRIVFRHVLPNVMHLAVVQFALLFVSAIKAEVILSYLGLGVQGEPSWGVMIDQARAELINGFYWQIGAASAFMFLLVLAFNVLADTVQDVLDPRVP